ncbi:sulfotransferase family protein [Luteimonas sp. SDU82]|uniref:sulfotransferase family protein n=1 Tax=Luteimonas sp. SDU82 TaxID=3422592 RepID=UPI003EBD0377
MRNTARATEGCMLEEHYSNGGVRAPVAIGGVGGSGTRVVAELIDNLGIHIGTDLNDASDTLWFTLLFKREEVLDCSEADFDALTNIFVAGLTQGAPLLPAAASLVRSLAARERAQHPARWLEARAVSLIEASRRPAQGRRWGWKEPNTHIVIERLWQRLPELRYIHVVRNGVQMASSSNQNQLRLWGPRVLGEDGPATPGRSLAYWCRVHRRMQDLLARNPERMLWLDFDSLCRDPEDTVARLGRFLGYPPEDIVAALPALKPPARRESCVNDFDPSDLAYVASLGYVI